MYTKQVAQLSDLIQLINGDSSKNDRKKLITLCTIDVHARDVVQRLIDERVESASAFQWQSQLRYTQHPKTKECQVDHLLLSSRNRHKPLMESLRILSSELQLLTFTSGV